MAETGLSPSMSFRDSDDEFLQKQARTWLEATLGEKMMDSRASLVDLLADGAILYRVAQLMKELMRRRLGDETASPKLVSPDIGIRGKIGSRYVPYTNIEAFLKVCKDVGLRDVDLLTPPDAVEKKDIRRVCVCIRRLSKKARAQQLPVPDFDDVTHTLATPTHKHAMPHELVGGLRESLLQSASKPSSKSYTNLAELGKETSSSIAELRKEASETQLASAVPESGRPQDEAVDTDVLNGLQASGDGPVSDKDTPSKPSDNSTHSPEATVHTSATQPQGTGLARNGTQNGAQNAEVVNGLLGGPPIKPPGVSVNLPEESEKAATVEPESAVVELGRMQDKLDKSRDFVSEPSSIPMAPNEKAKSSSREEPRSTRSATAGKPSKIYTPLSDPPRTTFGREPQGTVSAPVSEQRKTTSGRDAQNRLQQSKAPEDKLNKERGRKRGLPWLPVVAGVVVFVGTLVAISIRANSPVYQVKEGDTLSLISRRAGKSSWQELVQSNPGIANPDLIYPSDRLKL